MCISSFIHPSCRGVVDMALKHYPPPPPLPFQWLSGKSKKKNKNNNKMKIHDVDDGSKKESSSSCESPRSVLESSEGLERNMNSNRVGLAIVVAFEVEKEAIATPHTLHYKAPTTPPISLQHCHKATLLALQEDDVEEEEYDDDDDDDDEDEEETERERERVRGISGRIVPSIFSVGSPLLASTLEDDEEESPWPLMEEALTACFLCKRSFEGGKDIYIYRGDRAFCSEECRYQQVMVDKSWHSDCSPLLY